MYVCNANIEIFDVDVDGVVGIVLQRTNEVKAANP